MSIARQFLREFRPLFQMLEEPFSRPSPYPGLSSRRAFDGPFLGPPFLGQPVVDVTDGGDKYILEADIPGVKKENVEVRIGDAGRSVTIEGRLHDRRKQPQPTAESSQNETAENQISAERSFAGSSTFSRTVWLPRLVDSENVSAKLDDGVLTITVNKMEDKASVVVPIE